MVAFLRELVERHIIRSYVCYFLLLGMYRHHVRIINDVEA